MQTTKDFSYRLRFTEAEFQGERTKGYLKLLSQDKDLSALKPRTVKAVARIISSELYSLICTYGDVYSSSLIRDRLGLYITARQLERVIKFCHFRGHQDPLRQRTESSDEVNKWRIAENLFVTLLDNRSTYEKAPRTKKLLPRGKYKTTDMPGFTPILREIVQVINKDINRNGPHKFTQEVFFLTSKVFRTLKHLLPDFQLTPGRIKSRVTKTSAESTELPIHSNIHFRKTLQSAQVPAQKK